jgi:phosphatidylinositol alpha-1,6-mannosyltransferase
VTRHLFVTQDFPPQLGGMSRRHVELCRRFAPEPVTVSTPDPGPAAEAFDRREPYRVVRQPFTKDGAKLLANEVRWAAGIARWCRGGDALVHLGNLRPCGYAVGLGTLPRRTPYLIYVNGGDLLRERRFATQAARRWSGRQLLSRALGIVANSAWTADLARETLALYDARPVPVAAIDLGTDPEQFSPRRDTGALRRRLGVGAAPLLLTVARLVPHKGQDVALRALAALAAEAPDARLLLVGEGHDRPRLETLARELGVAARVIFAGTLGDGEIAEAYATATLYVGLSRLDNAVDVEGFGISFIEAAASALPSVAGDSGGVRSAVRDGETGLVVPPTDVAAVAAAIRALLSDEPRRRAMGAAARRAAETHYTWDRVARETLAFARARLAETGRQTP